MALSPDLISKHSFCADLPSPKLTSPSKQNAEMSRISMRAFQDGGVGHNVMLKHAPQVSTPAATITLEPISEVEASPLQKIKTGFLKFKEYYKQEEALFAKLAETQSPPFLIIACADSRVDPCKILDLGLGDAFVVRNVANFVPPYDSHLCSSVACAMEFAIVTLKVKHVMVIGHSRCAGIRALMGMKEDGSERFSEHIEDWVVVGQDAKTKVKNMRCNVSFDEQCTHCEKESVNLSLSNCLSFPFVRERVESGELFLHGAYYDYVNCSFERWTKGLSHITDYEKFE